MTIKLKQTTFARIICAAMVFISACAASAAAEDGAQPRALIEQSVQTLLDEFTAKRDVLESDKRELFALVDRVAVPLFDMRRIAKLVLAKNWKKASETQREMFTTEFQKLLIGTYATALYQYSGDEKMVFIGAGITERGGRKFAKVHSEVTLGGGAQPIPVDYDLLLNKQNNWKIYKLTINGLSMIANYRGTYAASVNQLGMDGLIESMQKANAKNLTQ